ncbi:chemotaxis protein CheW [Dyella sp. ASV21]|uniref:chemotaxis protein CheW n=1 Tax=Dyella sp. ASV21 TaxID=2795114 RepID=UPI0018EC4DE2|nr:chemotaxis protein CheW [Dyella sp. ASV21]
MEPSAFADKHEAAELFGSFHLAGTELVLSVTSLQEVVSYPSDITTVPLAPSFLLGLFNLRGTLIPIVRLRELLQLGHADVPDGAKIAIIDAHHTKVGLLFDSTGEILRVPGELKIDFGRPADSKELIGGVLKLDNGNRILQILSHEALAQLQDLPRLNHDTQREQEAARARAAQSQRTQCVSFRVGNAKLALPMSAIHEIIRVPELQKSVLASALCLGILNLRGNTMPVIDFGRFLALPPKDAAAPDIEGEEDERRIIVLKQDDMHFGLLVDAVDSIVAHSDDELLAMPSFDRTHASLFRGCIRSGEGVHTILLDAQALLSDAVIDEVTQGHRELYQDVATLNNDAAARRGRSRETYVTFRLKHLIGAPIQQLREVIEFPADLIRPPGTPGHVCGVLNLRRKLIPIMDLRALYGMPPYEDVASTRILIVEHEGEKCGLMVDSVENIVTVDAADKLPVPRVLLDQTGTSLQHDMKEVVELAEHQSLMLLNLASLMGRVAAKAA